MICSCENRNNITINTIYNFGLRHILIKGCGIVVINAFSLYGHSLESLELTDLEKLRVRGFALSRLQMVENFSISNVQNMQVDRYGFSALYNINTLSISNVTWQDMREGSFEGVATVQNFIIKDSEFENLKTHALILHNITKFHVKNSHFGTLGNRSLLLHGAKEILFENCSFAHTNYSMFTMTFINMLSFQSCSFDVLDTSAFFVDKVDDFKMSNCTVSCLKTRAFENVRVLNSIQFSNNIINQAEEDSVFFNTDYVQSKMLKKDLRGNRITCDCNLSWLWENQTDIYRDFIENSFCIGNSNGVKISCVGPLIRSKSECSKLNGTLFGGENEASPTSAFYTVPESRTALRNGTRRAENNEASSTSVFYTISESRTAQRNGTPFRESISGAMKQYPLYMACYLSISLWKQFFW